MDIRQVGIGTFEFDHVCKDGGKFWMRMSHISRHEAEELAEDYREILDELDDREPTWHWVARQMWGAFGFLVLLGSISVIVKVAGLWW